MGQTGHPIGLCPCLSRLGMRHVWDMSRECPNVPSLNRGTVPYLPG